MRICEMRSKSNTYIKYRCDYQKHFGNNIFIVKSNTCKISQMFYINIVDFLTIYNTHLSTNDVSVKCFRFMIKLSNKTLVDKYSNITISLHFFNKIYSNLCENKDMKKIIRIAKLKSIL